MAETALWLDYEFTVYDPEFVNWNEVGGLYVFAGLEKDNQGQPGWLALYLGETRDFSNRLPTHERWPESVELGATHIHALVMRDPDLRAVVEQALIDYYEPVLNTLLVE